MGTTWATTSLLSCGSDTQLAHAAFDAELCELVDGGGDAVDSGCVDQCEHGAVSRVCRGHSAGGTEDAGLCDAESVYRSGRGDRIGTSLVTYQRISHESGRWGREGCSYHSADLFLHWGGCLYERRVVDYCDHSGISTRRHGGFSQSQEPQGRSHGQCEGDPGGSCGYAGDNAEAGAGAVVYLAWPFLHVALFSGSGGAQRVWRK